MKYLIIDDNTSMYISMAVVGTIFLISLLFGSFYKDILPMLLGGIVGYGINKCL